SPTPGRRANIWTTRRKDSGSTVRDPGSAPGELHVLEASSEDFDGVYDARMVAGAGERRVAEGEPLPFALRAQGAVRQRLRMILSEHHLDRLAQLLRGHAGEESPRLRARDLREKKEAGLEAHLEALGAHHEGH